MLSQIIFPLAPNEAGKADGYLTEMEAMKNGALFWPRIGWNIKTVPGLDSSQEVTYANQYIPAPLHAWAHKNVTLNQQVFPGRDLPSLGANESRTFINDRYSSLLC